MSDARALTVGLVWHSINSGNLGVGALTASHIAILEKVAGDLGTPVEFQVFGFQEEGKPYISGKNIRYQPLRVKVFLAPNGGLYAAIRRSDVVCDIGGGDSFTDIYGLRRFVFLSFSKLAVLLFGKPLILSPQTIGPFKHAVTRTIAERLMRRCYAVIARDDLSYAILKRIGGNARTFVATDVAFRLPYASAPKVKGDKVKVGVNVSALLSGAAQDGQNTFGLQLDYPMLMRAILRHFTARDDCEVHLVSHVVSPHAGSEDDFQAAQTLHEEFPETIVVPPFASPSHAKSYISKLDFFCGARMHACIAAFSSGVPVVPIAYSRKFIGLFGSLGYPLVADCKEDSHKAALSKVIQGFDERHKLGASIRASLERADAMLMDYEVVLKECLTEVAAKK